MSLLTTHHPGENITVRDRFQALLEVFLVSGILSSLVASVPFALAGIVDLTGDIATFVSYLLFETFLALILLYWIIGMDNPGGLDMDNRLQKLGAHSRRWISNTVTGIAVIPVLVFANLAVEAVFQKWWPHYLMEENPIMALASSPADMAWLASSALLAGGIKEELQRAFILGKFRDYLGGLPVGLILWSAAFGAGHSHQGVAAAVTTGLFGLVFGLVYIWRGSLVAPMVAHGLWNLGALLLYWTSSK